MRASSRNFAIAVATLVLAFAVLYQGVLRKLVSDWLTDDNYSHGVFVVPIAAYFAWERRHALMQASRVPSALGLIVVLGSLAVLIAGILGAELFLTRISIVGVVAGAVLYILGWQHLRILALPIAFLLLMIPIPAIIFNQIAFPKNGCPRGFSRRISALCLESSFTRARQSAQPPTRVKRRMRWSISRVARTRVRRYSPDLT